MPARKMTIELFTELCIEIQTSNKGLQTLCKNHNSSASAFYDLLDKNKELTDTYVRARERQADFLADEIIEIADDGTNDTLTLKAANGEEYDKENTEWVNRSKLRVEARKWTAAKLRPKKYGDKLDLTSDGEKLQNTPTSISVEIVASKDIDED